MLTTAGWSPHQRQSWRELHEPGRDSSLPVYRDSFCCFGQRYFYQLEPKHVLLRKKWFGYLDILGPTNNSGKTMHIKMMTIIIHDPQGPWDLAFGWCDFSGFAKEPQSLGIELSSTDGSNGTAGSESGSGESQNAAKKKDSAPWILLE